MYVVPSNSLTTAPVAITTDTVGLYGTLSPGQSDGAGGFSGITPSGALYSTQGDPNADHVFYLNLIGASAPAPVQVTNLTLNVKGSAATNWCSSSGFVNTSTLANLTNPGSGFALVHVAGPDGTCNSSDDQFFLVNATAAATAAPTSLPITGNYQFLAYFRNAGGQLDGVLASDGSGNLVLFPDQTFSSSKILLAAAAGQATTYSVLYPNQLMSESLGSTGPVFVSATAGAIGSTVSKVYRVDQTGAVSGVLYTSQANGYLPAAYSYTGVYDQNNFYFTDAGSSQINVVQLALSGASTGVILYADSLIGLPPDTGVELTPIGSTGNQLVLLSYESAPNAGNTTTSGALETLTVGAANGTPAVIASVPSGKFGVGIGAYVFLQNSLIYATEADYTKGASGTSVAYTEKVLQLDGTLVSSTPNAAIAGFTQTQSYPASTLVNLLVAQGITATDGSFGGGTLYSGPLSGSATPMKTPGGQNAVLPSGPTVFFDGFTTTIGQGIIQANTATGFTFSYDLFDTSKSLLVELPVLN